MMATAHGVVGAAIMNAVPDPIVASGLILVSHYILDLMPHWDFGTDWKKRSKTVTGILALGDTLFAFLLAWLLFHTQLPLFAIIFSVSLSNLPDWLIAPYFMFFGTTEGYHKSRGGWFGKMYGKFLYIEEKYLHTATTMNHGITIQVITCIFFYVLLK